MIEEHLDDHSLILFTECCIHKVQLHNIKAREIFNLIDEIVLKYTLNREEEKIALPLYRPAVHDFR